MLESEKRHHYEIIKSIFLFAYKDNRDLKQFIKSFMLSDIAESVFKYCNSHYYHPYNVYLDIKEQCNVDKTSIQYSENFVTYIAFIYSKFYIRTLESPKKIYSYLPFNFLEKNYDHLHLLSEERVIYLAKEDYNLRNNAMRKVRSKNNADLSSVKEKESLFVARDIYLNLFYYPELEKLKYQYDDFGCFIDINTFIVSSTITSEDEAIRFLSDVKYRGYKFNKLNNIACLFLKDIEIEEINKSKIIESNNLEIPFDKVLLISRRHLTLISGTTSNNYYFVYTQNDLKRSLLKYQNRFTHLDT